MRTLLTLVILCCCSLSYGQGLTSEGREFYLGYIHPTRNDSGSVLSATQKRIYAVISSYTDNEAHFSYFDPQSGIETQANKVSIMAHRSVLLQLDDVLMQIKGSGDVAEFRSCHIVSKHPVAVHFFMSGSCATGGYLALPTGTWGKEYVIATDPDNPGYGGFSYPPVIPTVDISNGCFMIIAALNGTTVTITPNARTGGGHAGATQGTGATGSPQPYTVMLNRGQCYLVKSISALSGNTDDMSGSIVKADKPIAVIAAHENANVGDGTVRENSQTDARDFLIEQAIPWEYASHTGVVTIPMVDSKGSLEGGIGEDIKFFVTDNKGASAITMNSCGGSATVLGTAPYASPLIRQNAQQPLQYYCDSGKRFQAVQYELRSEGEGAPYPAPAMMNIIPRSNWRNAYLWHIPTKPQGPGGLATYQEYFVTVIGNSATYVSVNGANADDPQPVDNVLKSVIKKWTCVPAMPGLTATTYKISPNTTYYARSQYPFMVYVFGYAATHESPPMPTSMLNYSGFAYPVGMRGKTLTKARLGATVEESCTSWRLCAVDSNGAGVKSITLLNDPYGDFFYRNELGLAWPPQVAVNCKIDMATSMDSMEIMRLIPEQSLCATISVIDSTKDAYAPVVITDASGNIKLIQLNYTGKQLSPGTDFAGFDNVRIGDTGEKLLVVRSQKAFLIEKIEHSDSSTISIIVPRTLPFLVTPKDSLVLTVYYGASDTLVRTPTIRFINNCMTVEKTFSAKGATGLIYAEDRDFGNISQAASRCLDLRIDNKGSIPYTLLPNVTITGSSEFRIDSAELATLPVAINPGGTMTIKACYRPSDDGTDTAFVEWTTDLSAPYSTSIKHRSMLTGRSHTESVHSLTDQPIRVRPNPNSGVFTLDLSSLPPQPVNISIFNSLGVECYRADVLSGKDLEMQVGELPSANYVLRVTMKNSTVHDLRLIIQ